jgi:hypothetical protein
MMSDKEKLEKALKKTGNYFELLRDEKEPVDLDAYLAQRREDYAREKDDKAKKVRKSWFDEEGHY